jgi:shikimate kinase
MKLYLIGMPGSGKSVLGKKLANALNISFIDLDEAIVHEQNKSISEIFAERGEDYFRSLEAIALRQQSKKVAFVMACGGGTPCFHDNMKFINESGTSIFLNTSLGEIISRLETADNQRPLLKLTPGETLERKLNHMLEKRNPFYQQAKIIIAEEGDAAVDQILRQLKS